MTERLTYFSQNEVVLVTTREVHGENVLVTSDDVILDKAEKDRDFVARSDLELGTK